MFAYPAQRRGDLSSGKINSVDLSTPISILKLKITKWNPTSLQLPVCVRAYNGTRFCILNQFHRNPESDHRAAKSLSPASTPPPFATLNLNGTRRFSGGHVCGPWEAVSLLSADFLACFVGVCSEWQLWNHFSFCQVVVRLSGVSLLYWPLRVISLENIWFSLFPLKKKEGAEKRFQTLHLTPKTQTQNKHGYPLEILGGGWSRRRGPDVLNTPHLILMSDNQRSWEGPFSRTCSAEHAVLWKNRA